MKNDGYRKQQLKTALRAKAAAENEVGELNSGKECTEKAGGEKAKGTIASGSGNTKTNGASGVDGNNYAGQINLRGVL